MQKVFEKCNVNFKYKTADIKNEKVKLIHTNTGDIRNININILRKYFIYAYCYTAHSKQGCSVDSDIVIYDWNSRYACKNWFYTSLAHFKSNCKGLCIECNKGLSNTKSI